MTVVVPPAVFLSVVADFTTEDDDIAEYDSMKSDYAFEDVVKIASLRMKYRLASETVNAGVLPNKNSTTWIASPLNQYAAFYYGSTAPTVGPNGIKWIISPAHMDTAFLQDVSGDDVIVTLKDRNGDILEIESRPVTVWKRTTFSDIMYPKSSETIRKPQFDIFNPFTASMEIEITGNASCRFVVPGKKEKLSYTLSEGMDYSIDDFYDKERDAWGDIVWGESRIIETASLPSIQYNDQLNTSVNNIMSIQGKPILMIADDRDYKDREFPFVNLFGKIDSTGASLSDSISEITFEMKGI